MCLTKKEWVVCHHCIRNDRQKQKGVSTPTTEETDDEEEIEAKIPPGWDEKRVREVIEHYENQTEEEHLAEIEAALEGREHHHDGGADRAGSEGAATIAKRRRLRNVPLAMVYRLNIRPLVA